VPADCWRSPGDRAVGGLPPNDEAIDRIAATRERRGLSAGGFRPAETASLPLGISLALDQVDATARLGQPGCGAATLIPCTRQAD
jgi:hypothetical protein